MVGIAEAPVVVTVVVVDDCWLTGRGAGFTVVVAPGEVVGAVVVVAVGLVLTVVVVLAAATGVTPGLTVVVTELVGAKGVTNPA